MPALAHQHCLNHDTREAVAQCPECRHFFCRECVTEHDDRLLCASCLRKISKAGGSHRHPFRNLARAGMSLAGLLMASLFFYWLAQILLMIPTSFHDGTLWKLPFGGNE
jgi:hypothetical protein